MFMEMYKKSICLFCLTSELEQYNRNAFLYFSIEICYYLVVSEKMVLKGKNHKGAAMRELFRMDQKDYKIDGKVVSRPSVRAVIIKENKVLLVYSQKYDYYKFPGGGINPGEDHITALAREVQEETGYCIIADTIEEYGYVLRRHHDSYDVDCIFEQENFYYFCDVMPELQKTNLDDYEKEEGFTPVWIEPFVASRHNLFRQNNGGDSVLIKRDEKVLDLLDLEIRSSSHKKHEKDTIDSLGELNYSDMLSFVEHELNEVPAEGFECKVNIFYSRFEHTKRVLGWAKRLYEMSECKENLNYENLMIATIFHDVGRNVAMKKKISHAEAGVSITQKYLVTNGFDKERASYIASLVGRHSDKHRMKEDDIDQNLLLLMEADLLDDMGALGIVMDCMITEARKPDANFEDCLNHITRYTYRQQHNNPMITNAGKRLWEKKTKLVDEFVAALTEDVVL